MWTRYNTVMSKRIERSDVSVYILRHKDGRYLSGPAKSRFDRSQRRAFRFGSRREANDAAKKLRATVVRLIVRLSEEEG